MPTKTRTTTKRKTAKTKQSRTKTAATNGAKKLADKNLSALDAAAKVLHDAKKPLTTKEMIDVMKTKKLWTSPGGKTPHATLYSAILREIDAKGNEARFKKTERGKFTSNT